MNSIEIGNKFEKEAFEFLKTKFDKVIWLSKEHRKTPIDFKCFKGNKSYLIEAKYLGKTTKPSIKWSQRNIDFLVLGTKLKIELIPKKDLKKKATFEKKPKYEPNYVEMYKGGYEAVVNQYGGSLIVRIDKGYKKYKGIKKGDYVKVKIEVDN